MANFDLDGYFAKRNGGGTDKLESLAQASQDKVNQLMAYQSSKANVITPVAKKQDNSWVTKANLDPNGFVGGAVNLAASVAQSIPAFAAETGALITDGMGYHDINKLTDADSLAYAKYNQGTASAEDIATLNQRRGYGEGAPTALQLFERIEAHRKSSENLREAGNFKDIVHQGKRDRLTNELGADFQTAWNQTKEGASDVMGGNTLSGAVDAIAGASKLVANTGKALGTNGGAVAEFAADNLVQLYAGTLGKAGKFLMGANNAGIASGHLQTGIKRYAEVHDGALPPAEQLKDMSIAAVAEAAADQVQDLAQVGWAKTAGKGVKDAARTGFIQSLKSIGGAGLKGGASEFPVEGFQTYAEGKASLKHVSDKDIYVGASIGLGSGGVVTGGLRTASEIAGATPEQQAKKQKEESTFRENIKAGNTDPYLDKESKDYDPVKAMQVNFANSIEADATPEAKQRNLDKANTLIDKLEGERDTLDRQVNSTSVAGIKKQIAAKEAEIATAPAPLAELLQLQLDGLKGDLDKFDSSKVDLKVAKKQAAQLGTLDRQLVEATKLRDKMLSDARIKTTEADVIAAVDSANAEVDTSTEEGKAASQASAKHVVSLAMANPGMFSEDHLNQLADNVKNGLSDGQRAYLRSVSAYKLAENAAKTDDIVSKEVFNGDPKLRQLGIADYTKRMANAISANNGDKASTALHMLTKFAEGHAQKKQLISDVYAAVKGTNKETWIVPTKQGWEIASDALVNSGEDLRAKFGGLKIAANSPKLVAAVNLESAALEAAKVQLQSAYNLQFNPSAVVSSTQPPVVSATPAPPVVTAVTPTPNQSTKVDSTVNPVVASTPVTPATTQEAQAPAPVVKPDPTKDYVGTDKDGNQTDLSQGGVPYTFDAVRKAKKKNPMLRIIKHGDGYVLAPKTEKQLAAEVKAKERLLKPMTAKPGFPMALHEYVAALGGLSRDNDKGEMNEEKNIRIGNRWLFAAKGKVGTTLDDIRELVADIYAIRDSDGSLKQDLTEADISAAIKESLNNNPIYRINDEDDVAALLDEQDKDLSTLSANALDQYYALSTEADLLFESNAEFKAAFEAIISNHEATLDEMVNSIEALIAKFKTDVNNETSAKQATQSPQAAEETGEVSSEGVTPEADAEETGDKGEGRLAVFQPETPVAKTALLTEVAKAGQLFAHYFKQTLQRDGDTSVRPLVAVKDFLSSWKGKDVESLAQFLPKEAPALLPEQRILLNKFMALAPEWNEKLRESLVSTYAGDAKRFTHNDPIQELLITGADGKLDLPENVKTAMSYAAVTTILESATRGRVNTDEDINRLLGRGEDSEVTPSEREQLQNVLGHRATLANRLGQKTLQALGISDTQNTPMNLQPRLEAAIGDHIFTMLRALDVMVAVPVNDGDIQRINKDWQEASMTAAEFSAKQARDKDLGYTTHTYVALNYQLDPDTETMVLTGIAREILEAGRGNKGVLDNLFSVDSGVVMPTLAPVEFTQTHAKNGMELPTELIEYLKKHNQQPNTLKQASWNVYENISDDTLVKMASGEWVIPGETQAMDVDAINARNDALQTQVTNLREFVTYFLEQADEGKDGAYNTPFFFQYTAWNQQRVGLLNNTINPQMSKLIRAVVQRAGWESTISTDSKSDSLQDFKLRVLEGLGSKTNNEPNSETLKKYPDLFEFNGYDDYETAAKSEDKKFVAINRAVRVIAAQMDDSDPKYKDMVGADGKFTANAQKALIAGVQAGGEQMHSFDAIVALAQLRFAQQNGHAKFKTSMIGETDGVTNGPIIAHALFGAANSPEELAEFLKKGGFLSMEDAETEYNAWHKESGNYDLYEGMTVAADKVLKAHIASIPANAKTPFLAGILAEKYAAVESFIGDLMKGDKVTSAGRNLSKDPIRPLVFGSSTFRAIESMAESFVAGLGKKLAKIPDNADARRDALVKLNRLLWTKDGKQQLDVNMSRATLMLLVLTPAQRNLIKEAFKSTYGEAYKETVETELESFLASRNQITETSSLIFGLYNAVYQSLREEYIQRMIKEKKIDAFDVKDKVTKDVIGQKPYHDLTPKQEKEFQKSIAHLIPMMHTPMSQGQGHKGLKAGLPIFKSNVQLSQNPLYSAEVHLADKTKKNGSGSRIETVHGTERVLESSGVNTTSMPNHASDSAISQRANPEGKRGNMHDAQITGVSDFKQMGLDMNAALWDVLIDYSPVRELADTLERMIQGIGPMLQRGNNKVTLEQQKALQSALAKVLADFAGERGFPSEAAVLTIALSEIKNAAHTADTNKLTVLGKNKVLNQYASEGAGYKTTKDNRDEANYKLSQLPNPNARNKQTDTAIDLITNMTAPRVKEYYAENRRKFELRSAYKTVNKLPVTELTEVLRIALEDTSLAQDVLADLKRVRNNLSKPDATYRTALQASKLSTEAVDALTLLLDTTRTTAIKAKAKEAREAEKALWESTGNGSSVFIFEHDASGYTGRTAYNVESSDVTMAYAVDYTTAGEKATAQLAGKDKLVTFDSKAGVASFVAAIVAKLKERKGTTLNVAGNGIYTWAAKGYTQAQVNEAVYAILKQVKEQYPQLTMVISGGQTGTDIAGAIAARKLGIITEVMMPRGYLQRNENKADKQNTKADILKQIFDGAAALGKTETPTTRTGLAAKLEKNGTSSAKEILRDLWTQFKGEAPSETRNFRVTLLAQLGKLVSDDLNVVWGARTAKDEQETAGTFDRKRTINISKHVSEEGLADVLMHEVTHAVTHHIIDNDPNSPLVKELNNLLIKVQVYLFSIGAPNTVIDVFEGPNGIHELVAWGMTDTDFQKNVLAKIQMESENKDNRFVKAFNALHGFIKTITAAIFGENNEKKQTILNTGMDVLITNVSGLLQQASEAGPINIWYGTNENAVLSNLQQRPFTYAGNDYISVEHAYQTLKSGERDTVTDANYKAQGAGKKIQGTKAPNEATKFDLMKNLIKASFEQNPEALKALLATGNRQLTHKQDNGTWGHAFPTMLMEVREELSDAKPLAMAKINDIQNLTTESLYNALDEGKVTPTFDDHLRSLLTSIVDKLHGPYGTFKSQIERNLVRTPKGLWNQAKKDGTVPFASEALSAPIQMNDQVAFVLEQVEVTVASALANNIGEGHAISVELNKLYKEAQTKLTGANSPLSQEMQDFLFKINDGKHLSRFAALGLANPEVNAALRFETSKVESKANSSFANRLETLFHKILEWFNNKLAHTQAGQRADNKLTTLVNQLVTIEEKRKAPMLVKASTLSFVEGVLQSGTDKIRGKVEAFGRDKLDNSRISAIRTAGAIISTIAGDRTDEVMENLQKIRDKQFRQGHGLIMGMINEVRGANDGNKMFHALLREAKLREGNREDAIIHTSNIALESFANKGKDLTQDQKKALSIAVLRTDLSALLGPFTMDQIQEILSSATVRNQTIKDLESQLAKLGHRGFYERQSKILGYKLAKGKVKGKHLLMNATNIANLAGTNTTANSADVAVATPIIDQLVSLYALRYTESTEIDKASEVMKAEAKRGNESGVEMIMRLHKSLQQQSKEQLFDGSEALMMKGYLPEIYDPKKEVVIATEADGKALLEQGYRKEPKHVTYDPTDPSRMTERFLYTRDGGGLRPWLSGAMSFTGEVAKGSRERTDSVKDLADWVINQKELAAMYKHKQASMAKEFVYDPDFDPEDVKNNYAAPVLNADGQVANYRYLMQEDNKDLFLNRDNRFDKVLGAFAGSIYDKTTTKEHNRKVIQTLHDQYNADFATKSVSYRVFGPNSTDPELRDMYRMLPEDTKQAIKDIWGEDEDGTLPMMIRSDLMDITFGYRKQSITDAFNKDKKNIVEKMFVSLATQAMGGKAAYNIRRVEDVWQELVGEVKDILVVKNVSTLMGNIGSNVSLLYWQGVPFKDMLKYHQIAMKGITNYRADSAALIELEIKLAAGVTTSSKTAMQHEIARLKAAIDANPVKEIIDAGLMPSIVEDVSPDNDVFSYKSRLVGAVDDHTNKWNKHVISGARFAYMSKDTKAYKVLRHATQLSDFVARYTLYQHVTTRKDNPMSKADAVQLASDSFINYDIPSHRNLQYMNDMGFVMFTKYYMRIQKVIAHLYADKPGRALAMLAFESYFANAPMLTDSGFIHRMGNNPFTIGAFNYPGTLDELATIKAISYPFK